VPPVTLASNSKVAGANPTVPFEMISAVRGSGGLVRWLDPSQGPHHEQDCWSAL
jgi:hypothetical protein